VREKKEGEKTRKKRAMGSKHMGKGRKGKGERDREKGMGREGQGERDRERWKGKEGGREVKGRIGEREVGEGWGKEAAKRERARGRSEERE
jgi:hypothetical protein